MLPISAANVAIQRERTEAFARGLHSQRAAGRGMEHQNTVRVLRLMGGKGGRAAVLPPCPRPSSLSPRRGWLPHIKVLEQPIATREALSAIAQGRGESEVVRETV